MPHTQKELRKLTGKDLSHIAATLCLGWVFDESNYVYRREGNTSFPAGYWHPHEATQNGKAQCFDLAKRYKLSFDFVSRGGKFQHDMIIAAILAAQAANKD